MKNEHLTLCSTLRGDKDLIRKAKHRKDLIAVQIHFYQS